jgi:hypothetical protein
MDIQIEPSRLHAYNHIFGALLIMSKTAAVFVLTITENQLAQI